MERREDVAKSAGTYEAWYCEGEFDDERGHTVSKAWLFIWKWY